MSTVTQIQPRMSPQVKRGVIRWAVRETMGVVMLAALLEIIQELHQGVFRFAAESEVHHGQRVQGVFRVA